HKLGSQNQLNWVIGANLINKEEPDFRRFRTNRDISERGTENPFQMQLPPSSNLFDASRFWSSLKDNSYSNSLNFERKFGDPNEKRVVSFKAGYLVEYRTRDFNARYLSYLYPSKTGFDPAVGVQLSLLPIADIFAPQNIKRSNGFEIEEGTNPTDSYSGTNLLTAG
ncbi:MAG: TonB-dependent receptor, partial [Flammeovirgaceae bacterium]